MLLHPRSTLFPYTTLFRSKVWALRRLSRYVVLEGGLMGFWQRDCRANRGRQTKTHPEGRRIRDDILVLNFCPRSRSEEHTSELQSRVDLVCRLLLEKKKII